MDRPELTDDGPAVDRRVHVAGVRTPLVLDREAETAQEPEPDVQRRSCLAAIATLGTAGVSGCLDLLAYDDPTGEPALESDRPAVDETFVAGPMEPRCPRGEFPPMSERSFPVQDLPADRDVATVEAFARNTLGDDSLNLRAERPERLGWRGQTYDIASRYNSERYFVGWAGAGGDDRAVLVVLHEAYTDLVVFETADRC